MEFMEPIKDVLPNRVLNVATAFLTETGISLAASPRIVKVTFTGETTTRRLIMQYGSKNLTPVSL